MNSVSFQVPFGRPAMDVGVGGGGLAVAGGVPAVGGGGGASAAVATVNAALQQVHMQPQPPQPKAAGKVSTVFLSTEFKALQRVFFKSYYRI